MTRLKETDPTLHFSGERFSGEIASTLSLFSVDREQAGILDESIRAFALFPKGA
jgi:hypothetical protein